ncbi:hypothetical protein [Actinoallomurus soli]|uniref:hypothetical protein n=1 Tax=Actinoallomurus soli TaxID=2952535 RepID=UPI0020924C04|nr:hypothetical protein [Actinoallomurus soli]MCO5967918.1 hypothetical protein [Actinoallomurus soli]
MTWDWLAPTTTGVVGLAGLVATSLTAYTQQRNQLKVLSIQRSHNEGDTLRAEKRDAYLKFLQCLNEVTSAIYGNLPDSTSISYGKIVAEAHEKLSSALDELELVAPEWVVRYARILQARALQWLTAMRFDAEAGMSQYERVIVSRTYLMTAIRADMFGYGRDSAEKAIERIKSGYKEEGFGQKDLTDQVVKAWNDAIESRRSSNNEGRTPPAESEG